VRNFQKSFLKRHISSNHFEKTQWAYIYVWLTSKRKYAYLLFNINNVVDGASEFQVLSFLDAYSGYNQIRMHALVKEKTTFITEDANFCYRVMSFGLKNAGAT